jgi:hypothetical protein
MLDEYYAYRGLSKKGLHTKERLIDAELEAVAIVLDKSGLVDKRSKKNGYRSLDTIIRNPSAHDIGNGVKAKLRNIIRKHVMKKLGASPIKYRAHFNKIGIKNRKKAEHTLG